jgi:predicted SAM-dependent methyltransferase
MNWPDVLNKESIYLNFGGNGNCHPNELYKNYISVDLAADYEGWIVRHDLRNPIPLPDNSITRVHTEDFIEHLDFDAIKNLLAESYRLLLPGGVMRIGVPDYNNPKDRQYLNKGSDPRLPLHLTLTNYNVMKKLIELSPFARYQFYHYWDGDNFINKEIDYSLGFIKRTPDNDPRCRRKSILKVIQYGLGDIIYIISNGFKTSRPDMLTRKGRRLFITSVVVDLFKD